MKVALLPKGTRGQAVQAMLTLRYGDEKSLFGIGDVPAFAAALLDRGTAKLESPADPGPLRGPQRAGAVRRRATPRLTVGIKTTRDNLPAVVALVGEVLRDASFPAAALEEVRPQALADIESRRKEPEALVDNAHRSPRQSVSAGRRAPRAQLRRGGGRCQGRARRRSCATSTRASTAPRTPSSPPAATWTRPRCARRSSRRSATGSPRPPSPACRRRSLPSRPSASSSVTPDKQNATMAVAPGPAAVGQRRRLRRVHARQPHPRAGRQLAPVEAHPRDRGPVLRRRHAASPGAATSRTRSGRPGRSSRRRTSRKVEARRFARRSRAR